MHSSTTSSRTCIARDTYSQPRTFRVALATPHQEAYRRLAVAILRLDLATLAVELRSARQAIAHADSSALTRMVRAA